MRNFVIKLIRVINNIFADLSNMDLVVNNLIR